MALLHTRQHFERWGDHARTAAIDASRIGHEGTSAVNGKLPIDVVQVSFYGSFPQSQLASNFLIGQTASNQNRDFPFAMAQAP
jgi:hypothetical protein